MYARTSDLLKNPLDMTITTTNIGGSFDPEIFGPPFWFVLHNAAVGYYDSPTEIYKKMMLQFIQSLPVIIPCVKCKEHAFLYLKNQDINHVIQNRRNLFNFFVNFHNYVNSKGGLPQMSLKHAEDLYGFHKRGTGGSVKITYI